MKKETITIKKKNLKNVFLNSIIAFFFMVGGALVIRKLMELLGKLPFGEVISPHVGIFYAVLIICTTLQIIYIDWTFFRGKE